MIVGGEATVYHGMLRTAFAGFYVGDVEKNEGVTVRERFAAVDSEDDKTKDRIR